MMKKIDLRSDTVTRPTNEMRSAMANANVGDDVYGEDPTVNQLEKIAANLLGTEDAIFASSGTQTNLLALMSHCQRGDEYIVGQQAHTYKYEGGGAAVLGSIQPQPIDFESDGTLDLEKVAGVIKPDDFHFARTRLLCLENTQAGKVLPLEYISSATAFCERYKLRLHMDGARVFNAAVKLDVPVHRITQHMDSISVCLSKGLGAPVGSLLCGSKSLIKKARRWRKLLGGGMRQSGILAAAGIVAFKSHLSRLAEDHDNAKILAEGLAGISEIQVDKKQVQTNMVFISMDPVYSDPFISFCEKKGVLVAGHGVFRLVTHLDITSEDIKRAIHTVKAFFQGNA